MVYSNLGLILVVSTIISIGHDSGVLTKVTAEIAERSNTTTMKRHKIIFGIKTENEQQTIWVIILYHSSSFCLPDKFGEPVGLFTTSLFVRRPHFLPRGRGQIRPTS